MTYIRKMKDWSEKVYYTQEEVSKHLKKRIRESAEELRLEFREYQKVKKKYSITRLISYV
jgi:hypothetical protein